LPNALIEEISQLDPLQTARRPARRTLVVDGGGPPGVEALLEHLRALDAAPALCVRPGQRFLITISHRAPLPDDAIDAIVAWLAAAHPSSVAPAAPAPRPSGPAPAGERPVLFGRRHPMFGLLTPGNPASAGPRRPPVLLTNAGCVNRSGAHRLYVRLARRWARPGFDVLRIDLSGIGDSPVAPGAPENVTYPPSGFEDLGEAILALGGGPVILAGLCSGGDYAFQLGARDPNIVGAWILNPRTFGVLDLATVESGEGAPPAAAVDEVPRTLRTMAGRGVDTLLLVSRNDPGVAHVDTHAGVEMRALVDLARFRRIDLDGTDHTFTPVAAQEQVSDLLTGHMVANY
jgi:pimeloyl-ACP methyl ester carboxylesterase